MNSYPVKKRILYMECNPHFCGIFKRSLEAHGYITSIAPDGKSGLALYADNPFDLVAVDCKLPDMDGIEIAKKLISENPELPLLMVTGTGSEDIAADALALGVSNYIFKDNEEVFVNLLPPIIQGLIDRSVERTIQKENEAALKSAKEKLEIMVAERSAELTVSGMLFQRVVDNMPIGVCLKDRDGKVFMANRQILEWWGMSEIEAIGKTTDEISGDPEDICRTRREQERLVWESREVQLRHHKDKIRPDGSRRHIIIRKIPILDEEGEMISLCNTVQDITDIDTAETANRAKSEFLSTMNHELRTPLTSIKGALSLLNSMTVDDPTDEKRELLDVSLRNTNAMLLLVNELLDYEKIISGTMVIETQRYDIGALTSKVVHDNQSYAGALSVIYDFVELGISLYAEVQEHRFEQVLRNLLSNAAKFSEPGSEVKVVVKRHNGAVIVSVKDDGPGISDEFRQKIFDPFTQIDSSQSRQYAGTGLGLSISKSLTEGMGGKLFFRSELGVGSTFSISFPVSE